MLLLWLTVNGETVHIGYEGILKSAIDIRQYYFFNQ